MNHTFKQVITNRMGCWGLTVKKILVMSSMLASVLLLVLLVVSSAGKSNPNVLFILIDDLGWANIGYHSPNNSEVNTPNIDELHANGLELFRHYTHYTCCPTRTSFQSGRLPVHVNIDNCKSVTDPQCGIPQNMTGIGTKMQQAGFTTYMIGKWDAGMATYTHTPKGRGYNTSFVYLEAAIDYFYHTGTACYNYNNALYKDIWQNNGIYEGPAYQYNNTVKYIEYIFSNRIMSILDDHIDGTDPNPFFMVYAPQLCTN